MSEPAPAAPPPRRRRRGRLLLYLLFGAVGLAAAAWFLTPTVVRAFTTISTDDAYVNGHVTLAAARVGGQVKRVLVDDASAVRKGELLVEPDPEPYRVQLAIRQAALALAEADLVQARATMRAREATARTQRFRLLGAIDEVRLQLQTLRANVITLKEKQDALDYAGEEKRRVDRLLRGDAVSIEEHDLYRTRLLMAEDAVGVAKATTRQTRAALGLSLDPAPGGKLDDAPPGWDQQHTTVRAALAELSTTLAGLGLPLPAEDILPLNYLKELDAMAAKGGAAALLARLVEEAPATKVAVARRDRARADVRQAELNLSYCEVRAEIDGVIARRNVNPGTNVQAGQALMAVRSLTEIWIDANFKETQLAELRIGQAVDVYADAYGKRLFKGRVVGFSPGTGSTLSLLPAENATGNFVKVVQRLPVRIALTEPAPVEAPLFIGLSVVPYVRYREEPTGENAGQKLQRPGTPPVPATAP